MDWSFLDKVVYINLERSPERNERMKEVLKPFGDKVIRFNAIDMPDKGWLGCTRSHVRVT
jgi:GR25 family glycosyltransferase involved in LPS biosynthesis